MPIGDVCLIVMIKFLKSDKNGIGYQDTWIYKGINLSKSA